MNLVRLLTIVAENRIGQLARVTRALADSGVNILWVTIADVAAGYGVIKLLVDKHNLALQALRLHGIMVGWIDVLAIEVEDRPGGLQEVADSLARHDVNVLNASGFVSNQRAVMVLEVNDLSRALEVLSQERLPLLSQDEMLAI